MAKPYDVVTKRLIESNPDDWLRLIGFPGSDAEPLDVELLDTDLATITLQADRVLKITSPQESLCHIELESGHHGAHTPGALLRYSVLLTGKYTLPVQSAVVLLRPEADSPSLSGLLEYSVTGDSAYLSFRYRVLRIWRLPVEAILSGGTGTLPLAPLADGAQDHLPEVIQRMKDRIDSELAPEAAGEIWAATSILMGLKYTQAFAEQILKGVRQMRESVTYQAILEEGRAEGIARGRMEGQAEGRVEGQVAGERQMLLRMAAKRLGTPSSDILSRIEAIDSPERLIFLGERIQDVESWNDLMPDLQ